MANREMIVHGYHEDSGTQLVRWGHDKFKNANMKVCKEIARCLQEFYPGYNWAITCDLEQGIATIALPSLMGATFKYVIFADAIATANDMDREIKKAGGEILERFRLSRRGLFMPEYCDVRSKYRGGGRFIKEIPV